MEKAECLNEYFTSVSSLDDTNCYLSAFELKCQSQLLNISCTASEIQSLIEILNPNKVLLLAAAMANGINT